MGTAGRKARKRAGEKFYKAPKEGTPLEQRSWWNAMFPGVPGTAGAGVPRQRSVKKRRQALRDRGIERDL